MTNPRRRLLQRSLFLLLFSLLFLSSDAAGTNSTTSCPLDYGLLEPFLASPPSDLSSRCSFALQCLHLLLAVYLRSSSLFLPPSSSDASCWSGLSTALNFPDFSLPSSCGFEASALFSPCMNLSSRSDFEALVPSSALSSLSQSCNRSLAPVPSCTACTAALNNIKASYLPGPDPDNVTTCTAYPFIYVAAYNTLGPTDSGTAFCIFLLNTSSSSSSSNSHSLVWLYALLAALVVLFVIFLAFCWWRRRRRRALRASSKASLAPGSLQTTPRALESIKIGRAHV